MSLADYFKYCPSPKPSTTTFRSSFFFISISHRPAASSFVAHSSPAFTNKRIFHSNPSNNNRKNDWRQIRRQGQWQQGHTIVRFPFTVSSPSPFVCIHMFSSSQIVSQTPVLCANFLVFCRRSTKAGLAFPVGRVHRLLRKGNYAQRVGAGMSR